jgi:hypothetical protein
MVSPLDYVAVAISATSRLSEFCGGHILFLADLCGQLAPQRGSVTLSRLAHSACVYSPDHTLLLLRNNFCWKRADKNANQLVRSHIHQLQHQVNSL